MRHPSRREALILFAVAVSLAAGIFFLTPKTAARHQTPIPPEDCGSCPAPYVGPNGGTCEPLGCIRPGGPCVLAGDCY
jgi:hypothetical protein